MPQLRFRCAVLLLITTSILVACGKSDTQSKPTAVPRADVTLVTVTPQLYLVGYFGAISQGYFEQEHLSATIHFTNSTADQTDSDVIAQVLAGDGQFGLVSADRILQARAEGQPLVAIASVFQRDPTAIIALKNKGITRPEDLLGKQVLIRTGETTFRLFASTTGLDISQITLVTPPAGSIQNGATLFITGQVDAMVANGAEATVQLAVVNIDADFMYVVDHGVANYPYVLFTTEAMVRDHADVVQRFVNAFIRGMQYAVENPEPMATWFVDTYHDQLMAQQLGTQVTVMQAFVPLINPPDSEPGVMTDATWQFVYEAMVQAHLLDSADVTQAYTRQFVNAYYKND